MKVEITSNYEVVEDEEEEVLVWRIDHGDGTILVNINRVLTNNHIEDCAWLDDGRRYISAYYYDWADNESTAIISIWGTIVRKSIYTIEKVIKLGFHHQFIVIMSGSGMWAEEDYDCWMVNPGDLKWAVLNIHGEFILRPCDDSIEYDEKEKCYWTKRFGHYDLKYNLDGKLIDEES
jgi:hypothetical protein